MKKRIKKGAVNQTIKEMFPLGMFLGDLGNTFPLFAIYFCEKKQYLCRRK